MIYKKLKEHKNIGCFISSEYAVSGDDSVLVLDFYSSSICTVSYNVFCQKYELYRFIYGSIFLIWEYNSNLPYSIIMSEIL
jgi:hypothetical protein